MYEFISRIIEELKSDCRIKHEKNICCEMDVNHIVKLSEIRLKYIGEVEF